MPSASANTTSGGLTVRIAAGDSSMPGTPSAGGLHAPSTGPSPPVAATATAPHSTPTATGGSLRLPTARAAR